MHIEKRKSGKGIKYYLAYSYREGTKVHKFRKYLGHDLTKLNEGRRNKDESLKKELAKAKAWIDEFDPKRLELDNHRLEVRFPSLKIELIQQIKQSPFVDQNRIGKEKTSIRVVLLADLEVSPPVVASK